jgi:hypothetical protein
VLPKRNSGDTVPEELKNLPGFLAPNMSPGPEMQNKNENFSQDFKNRSERRSEMPEMPDNTSQARDANATMKSREPHAQPPQAPGDTNNFTKEDGREEHKNPVSSAG